MLTAGPAKKVCIYVTEDQKYRGNSTYAAILDFLFYRGIAGATVTRGIAGFGADHRLHTTRLVDLTQSLPIKIEFIETEEKTAELMPKLHEMAGSGLIEIQDTTVSKAGRDSAKADMEKPPAARIEGKARLLRIYLGENQRWGDKPLHLALVEALRANDIAGVTVYNGIAGYGLTPGLHQEKPVMLSVVDSEDKLRAFMPTLEKMVTQAMVVISDVDIIKYTHNYQRSERRQEVRH